MQNVNKEYVDLYVPRRCYATNKILDSRDSASVQITVSDVSLIYVYYMFNIFLHNIRLTWKEEKKPNL